MWKFNIYYSVVHHEQKIYVKSRNIWPSTCFQYWMWCANCQCEKLNKILKNKENQHNQNLFNLSVIVYSFYVCKFLFGNCRLQDLYFAHSLKTHSVNFTNICIIIFIHHTWWALDNSIDVSCRPLRLHESFVFLFQPKKKAKTKKKSSARGKYFIHRNFL